MESDTFKIEMKVCHITSVHSPFDTRIFYKECKTLVEAGYEVTLIAQHDKNELINGVKIVALPKAKNRIHRMFSLTLKAFWLALKQKAEVYHFHDPELIPLGIILKLWKKKVIYDVHEDVPKQILSKYWIKNAYTRKFISYLSNIIEQIGASIFTAVVAATPYIAEKFPKEKTIILRNFPILSLIDSIEPIKCKKDKPVLIYAGLLAKIRGIKEIIQALELIGDKAELWLLGKWENEKFKLECQNLEGWRYTKYLGLKNLTEVYGFLKKADIGLNLIHPLERYKVSLPTKIFEYMACSLPVVTTESPYWKTLFKKGVLFVDVNTPKMIAEKIELLLKNKNLRVKMGREGRVLVENEYSWEKESKKLVELYTHLEK
jgi:glycosyltransferase involved in cell wall biosynthesis